MEFITNQSGSRNHGDVIADALLRSTRAQLAVAFFKLSGWKRLHGTLETALQRGIGIELFVGLDFYQTEPKALWKAFELFDHYPDISCLYIIPASGKTTFHPKVYCFHQRKSFQVLVGSANLTGSGLGSNDEASLLVEVDTSSEVATQFAQYFNCLTSSACVKGEVKHVIRDYEKEYKKAQPVAGSPATIPPAPRTTVQQEPGLLLWASMYQQDRTFQTEYNQRVGHYKKARKVLRKMIAEDADKKEFRACFDRLAGSAEQDNLWHSWNLYRKRSDVMATWRQARKVFAFANQSKGTRPQKVFDWFVAQKKAGRAKGIGANLFTEALNTVDEKTFAVLNSRSVSVVRRLGYDLPKNVQTYTGVDYRNFCHVVSELGRILDLGHLGHTDHFLHYLYTRFHLMDNPRVALGLIAPSRVWIKPLGTREEPYPTDSVPAHVHINMRYGKIPDMPLANLVLLYGVGSKCIVGLALTATTAEYDDPDNTSRWPVRVWGLNLARHFSDRWNTVQLNTDALISDYMDETGNTAVSHTGTASLGALQWGHDTLKLDPNFARFAIERVLALNQQVAAAK